MSDIAPRQPALEQFTSRHGARIAVRHRRAAAGEPTILFLPGYASDMDGQKAVAIDGFCAGRGLGCLRLDYSGTGSSSGDFADGTLDRWLDEVLDAVEFAAPKGRLFLAGSSMGGWLALHLARRLGDRVSGLLGIAAAPDFTDWGFSAADRETLRRDGRIERGGSLTTLAFWTSGEALKLLGAPIDLAVPVRLVHGVDDEAVPVAVALRLLDRLGSSDVQLRLIKGGGHRLSEPGEIRAILAELASLVDTSHSKVSAQ
jgi:pimeloyl-ACP methyl ester carboxylesterase